MFQVKSNNIWRNLRAIFIGALILFLINIYFGFDNSLTTGVIPRWQTLIHLHGGSVGWITLSAHGSFFLPVAVPKFGQSMYDKVE